jgi:hypothetical protein
MLSLPVLTNAVLPAGREPGSGSRLGAGPYRPAVGPVAQSKVQESDWHPLIGSTAEELS